MIDIVKETEHAGVEGKLLGQRVAAPKTYSPDILVAVPRIENRTAYSITDADFGGFDRWNCFECSFLHSQGAPYYLGLTITYPSNSWAIVESKSLKLYLNSFNMTNMGSSLRGALNHFLLTVQKDLSALLKTDVKVKEFNALGQITRVGDDGAYLEDIVSMETIEFNHFKEAPTLLCEGGPDEFEVYSKLLRSNCKVTHQPDCGTIFISYRGMRGVNLESLMQYIVSFRDENHFHEEVCEMVFKRLKERFDPSYLGVECFYTRRGGIDINPFRSTNMGYNAPVYTDRVVKTIFQ